MSLYLAAFAKGRRTTTRLSPLTTRFYSQVYPKSGRNAGRHVVFLPDDRLRRFPVNKRNVDCAQAHLIRHDIYVSSEE